jgi:hypothetical protein
VVEVHMGKGGCSAGHLDYLLGLLVQVRVGINRFTTSRTSTIDPWTRVGVNWKPCNIYPFAHLIYLCTTPALVN